MLDNTTAIYSSYNPFTRNGTSLTKYFPNPKCFAKRRVEMDFLWNSGAYGDLSSLKYLALYDKMDVVKNRF